MPHQHFSFNDLDVEVFFAVLMIIVLLYDQPSSKLVIFYFHILYILIYKICII